MNVPCDHGDDSYEPCHSNEVEHNVLKASFSTCARCDRPQWVQPKRSIDSKSDRTDRSICIPTVDEIDASMRRRA